MRLFPPELTISPEEGFTPENDIFGRKEFAGQLTRIVKALDDPSVLLLDAPWGSGKTTFVKMWQGELAKSKIPTIYFDAFANDYLSDAFLAVAGEIIDRAKATAPSKKKVLATFTRSALKVGKVIGRAGLHLGVRAVTAGILDGTDIEKSAGELLKAAEEESVKAVDALLKNHLENHRADRQVFDEFKNALRELAVELSASISATVSESADDSHKTTDGKLVFIIDELDRCRPSFSLEIIEKIKHFYSVPGIIFVLVTSIKQLETGVRFAYGDIDARTYLEKFYHLRFLFPDGTADRSDLRVATYIRHIFSKISEGDEKGYSSHLVDIFTQFSKIHSLSLRTIERICSYVSIVLISTNKRTFRWPNVVAILCILKVINPDLYLDARRGVIRFQDLAMAMNFSQWRDDNSGTEQSYVGKTTQDIWKYILGVDRHDDEVNRFRNVIPDYPGYATISVVTFICRAMDGFTFPDALPEKLD